jgi:single-strand DNA-binding protein
MDNTITIVGNVTRDPELTYTPSGQAKVRLGVAVNRRWFDKALNDWAEQTSFFDVTGWRELAENAADTLAKGSRVIVTGRLEQRSWDDKDTGQKRYAVEIIADDLGPSLRWATATVQRTEKDQGNGGPVQRQSAPLRAAPRPTGFDDDDAPF